MNYVFAIDFLSFLSARLCDIKLTRDFNCYDPCQGDYAIATMTFDQEKMHIDIVAHKDALNALAANRN